MNVHRLKDPRMSKNGKQAGLEAAVTIIVNWHAMDKLSADA